MQQQDTSRPAIPGLIWLLGALTAVGPLSMDMYLPGLPALTSDLHASASAAQLTLTGCMLGVAMGQLVGGPICDAHGRRRPLLVGMIAYVVTSLACAVAPSVWILLVLRVLEGVAGGFGIVIARAIVRDIYGGVAASKTFATLMVINGIAPVLAPLIGGQVLRFTDWRGVFVVLAAIGVPMVLAIVRMLPETLVPEQRHTGGLPQALQTFGRLLRDRSFAPYAFSYSVSFGAMFAYIAGSSYVLENVFKTSPQTFSLVFAANSIGLVAMTQWGSRLLHRHSPAHLFRIGVIGSAAGSIICLVVTVAHAEVGWLLVGLFVLVSFQGFVLPNGVSAAMADQPEALGSASALLGLGQFGVGAVIAPLVGVAGAHNAVPMGIVMAACGLSSAAVNVLFS